MQITSKGQVTIPQEIRNRLGLLPHTEVKWEIVDGRASVRKAHSQEDRKQRIVEALEVLRGSATSDLSTDEIMLLTRGRRMTSSLKKR